MDMPSDGGPMQAAIKGLQETSIILAHIDKMQMVKHEQAQVDERSEKLQLRIEKNLAEIREKLDRLIGPR
jgi:hypothetical protein